MAAATLIYPATVGALAPAQFPLAPPQFLRCTTARSATRHRIFASASPLDDIPGVGAARKRALLTHFGSAKAVSRAALSDLKAVEGVSEGLAQKVYDYFHEKG